MAPLGSLLIAFVMPAVSLVHSCSHSSIRSLNNYFLSTCHALGSVRRQGHTGGQGVHYPQGGAECAGEYH